MGSAVSKEPEKWPRKLPPFSPLPLLPPLPLSQMYYQGWKCRLSLGGWQPQGREPPPASLNGFPICFHFVTRRFYLSCLEGYLNNSPTGLKETEADNKYASLSSPEHHPAVKTSSHAAREMRRGRHIQGLSSHLPPPPVLPQPLMEMELFVNGATLQTGSVQQLQC